MATKKKKSTKKKPNFLKWVKAQTQVKNAKKRVLAADKKLKEAKKKALAVRKKAGAAYKRKFK